MARHDGTSRRSLLAPPTGATSLPLRVWSRSFTSVFVAYLFINLGLNFSDVLMSPFAQALGASPVVIGAVVSAFAIGALVFKLVSGPAIDAFRRKYVLMAAIVVIGASFFGYAMTQDIQVLMGFRVLQGIGQAFTATTCITLAADALPRERIASGLGIFAVAMGAGHMVGEPLALKIYEATSFRFTFLAAVGIMAVAMVAAVNIRTVPVKKRPFRLSVRGAIAAEALPPAALQLLFMLAWSCVNAFVVVVGLERGMGTDVGYFATVYGLGIFIAAPLGGRLIDRFGYVMLLPMMASFGVSLYLISVSSSLPVLLVAAAFAAFGYGAAGPVVRSMAMNVVPRNRRGAASSTFYLGSDVGQLAGPVLGGLLATTFGYATMFAVLPVYLILAAVVLIALLPALRRRVAEVSAAERDA
ncbi:MFS transporter [Demequina sp. NBRC 110051]|uniref:MFS transporter n=1 Tax=Demequina sp. NBRC 110051 TaxID=1570340 RepID=UPI0009FCEE64|nr:MFS transporter [Demequina sp. NBRC 110051]